MTILGINTTSKICEVSLKIQDNYKILQADRENAHSDNLVPMIAEILTQNELTINDIEAIVINIGPGSFTGIRVGIVVARTIAQLLNLKIYPVAVLDVLAYKFAKNNPKNRDEIVVLLDALREEFYCGIYDFHGKLIDDYKITNKKNLDLKNKVLIEEKDFLLLDKYLIECGLNKKAKDFYEIKPLYLRKTSAEEKKELNKNKNGKI